MSRHFAKTQPAADLGPLAPASRPTILLSVSSAGQRRPARARDLPVPPSSRPRLSEGEAADRNIRECNHCDGTGCFTTPQICHLNGFATSHGQPSQTKRAAAAMQGGLQKRKRLLACSRLRDAKFASEDGLLEITDEDFDLNRPIRGDGQFNGSGILSLRRHRQRPPQVFNSC
jgi:hypothetical protein